MAERLLPSSDTGHTPRPIELPASDQVSWWSWRPGISPISAILIGLPLLLFASTLITTGVYTLIDHIASGPSSSVHLSSVASAHAISPYSLPGSITLFLLGALMLPYALFLTFGGWHDLRSQKQTVSGRIIALRTTARDVIRQGRRARPGVTSGIARAWYGMALQPLGLPGQAGSQRVMIFRLNEERYRDLREEEYVEVVYSPHMHHVQSLRQINAIPSESSL